MIIPFGFLKKESAPINYPAYVDNGGLIQNTPVSADTINVPYPASVSVNDIAILYVWDNKTSAPHVAPSGWTLIELYVSVGRDYALYWKRMSGSEGGTTQQVEKSDYAQDYFITGIIYTFSGCAESVTPWENSERVNEINATTISMSMANLSSGDKRLSVIFYTQLDNRTKNATIVGYTDDYYEAVNVDSDNSTALATEEIVDSSTTDGSVQYDSDTSENVTLGGFYLIPK